jgi:hypothetical protein
LANDREGFRVVTEPPTWDNPEDLKAFVDNLARRWKKLLKRPMTMKRKGKRGWTPLSCPEETTTKKWPDLDEKYKKLSRKKKGGPIKGKKSKRGRKKMSF